MPSNTLARHVRNQIVVAVATVLGVAVQSVGTSLPAAHAAVLGIPTVTVSGPATAVLGQTNSYGGVLSVNAVGLPLQKVELRLDGTVTATATTAIGGTYAASATFPTIGTHQVQAVYAPGTPLEARSATVLVDVKPPMDSSAPTELHDSTTFLYEGPAPVQHGVDPADIAPERAAVVRGRVLDGAGNGVGGVRVDVEDHPEYGWTDSRADGWFDLAVNGGGPLTVSYAKAGTLSLQRQVDVALRDFTVAPDVVLTPLDPVETPVSFAATTTEMRVAQGSPVTDEDGTRQATLLFPPGTTATMTLPDGDVVPLPEGDVRATEYTVGTDGVESMPGTLPASSGYTYAVELSVDEALAAGATKVTFDRPVPTYLENFLDFPVGETVPTGYYDRELSAWVAAPNGRVVGIVSETAGRADVDVDGDGDADNTALGLTDAERTRLAELYDAGESLWRVPVTHFTPYDHNWPYGPDGDADPPNPPPPDQDTDGQCEQGGSVIGCENQTLGETVPVTGTPFRLHYDSGRVPGRTARHTLRIPVSGGSVPSSMVRMNVTVTVGGRSFTSSYTPSANLVHTFTWDGKDAYGRPMQGAQPASIRISYDYRAVYYSARADFAASFARLGTAPLSANRARQEISLTQDRTVTVGGLTDTALGTLGGWTLSGHHAYDPAAKTLHLGTGQSLSAGSMSPSLVTAAGTGSAGPRGEGTYTGDGGAATAAGLSTVRGLASGPDGTVYLADTGNGVVRRVTPDGKMSRFAGGGTPASGNGDGGAATNAELVSPTDVTVDANGFVYVLDAGAARVRRVAPDGTITTVAGGGNPLDGLGDGGPAVTARLLDPRGIAAGSGGEIYVADSGHDRVRRIDPDGVITTYAGGGAPADGIGDGLVAPDAALDRPTDVVATNDGTVYVSDSDHNRVRRIAPGGLIETFAGTGAFGSAGDGGPATQAEIAFPTALALSRTDGALYIADRFHHRIRKIESTGEISTFAGTGTAGYSGEQGPPAKARLSFPEAVTVDPEGRVWIGDTANFRVRRIKTGLPGFSLTDLVVPSGDGEEIYHFDERGRHLRTLDATTSAVRAIFGYDATGRLASVSDPDGNVVTVERNASGVPTAIVAPFGQRTTLTVTNGWLSDATNPAGENVHFGYGTGGLLTSMTDLRDGLHSYTYDSLGRLTRDQSPDGRWTELTRSNPAAGTTRITSSGADGKTATYDVSRPTPTTVRRTVTDPDGGRTTSVVGTDGTVTRTAPDGTVTTVTTGPDPRWGMTVPVVASLVTRTPAGVTSTVTRTRAVTLGDPLDPLTMTSATTTTTVDGNAETDTYVGSTRTRTIRTAEGRELVQVFDARGRVVSAQTSGAAPTTYTYDARGRLANRRQAGEGLDFGYRTDGWLDHVDDAAGTRVSYDYDLAGRRTDVFAPGGRHTEFGYTDGDRSSIMTPRGHTHTIGYNAAGLVGSYDPPGAGGGYARDYDLNRNDTKLTLPSGDELLATIVVGSRPSEVTYDGGRMTFAYASPWARITGMKHEVTGGPSHTTGYGYDGGLVTSLSASGAATGTYVYGYGTGLRRTSSRLTSGADVLPATTYAYDRDGLLKTNGVFTLTRTGPGGAVTRALGGGLDATYGYDARAREDNRTDLVGTTAAYSYDVTRGSDGKITKRTETVAGTARVYDYTYDEVGQLETVTRDGVLVESYGYDLHGNRTSRTVGGQTVSATYDEQDRLQSQGGTAYTIGADGFLASRGSDTFAFSPRGDLLSATVGSTTVTYAYDAAGRRVSRTVGGQTTYYLYGDLEDSSLVTAYRDPAGQLTTLSYDESGRLRAMERGAARWLVSTDPTGTPRVVTTSAGVVVKVVERDAYGRLVSDSDPVFALPVGFAGGLTDEVTGLVRFGVRDYDPETARWTSKDPAGFAGGDGTNLYAYVNNDPVGYRDPEGQGAKEWFKGVFGIGKDAKKNVDRASDAVDVYQYATDPNHDPTLDGLVALDCGLNHMGTVTSKIPGAKAVVGYVPNTARGITKGYRKALQSRFDAIAETEEWAAEDLGGCPVYTEGMPGYNGIPSLTDPLPCE